MERTRLEYASPRILQLLQKQKQQQKQRQQQQKRYMQQSKKQLLYLLLLISGLATIVECRPAEEVSVEESNAMRNILKNFEDYIFKRTSYSKDAITQGKKSEELMGSMKISRELENRCEGYTSMLLNGRGLMRYPQQGVYNSNDDCLWKIQAADGLILRITITRLSIEPSRNCSWDRLQIFDGASTAEGRSLGCFCGFELPEQSLLTTGSIATIWFLSDALENFPGFEVKYVAVQPTVKTAHSEVECAEVITLKEESGKLCYPTKGNYSSHLNCRWALSVPYGMIIQIRILVLDIELDPLCPACCTYDSLAIVDGSDNVRSAPLAKLCGTRPPPDPYITTSSHLMVVLTTDGSNSGSGFCLSYNSIAATTRESVQCDGSVTKLESDNGTLKSPGQTTGRYPNEAECHWLIAAKSKNPDTTIRFNFTMFTLEKGGSSCYYDRLTLYDGQTASAPIIGIYCGPNLPPSDLSTTSPYLYVELLTDDSINVGGFILNWRTVRPEIKELIIPKGLNNDKCEGLTYLTAKEGNITSPGFSGTDLNRHYKNGLNCAWVISAPPDMKIVLRFEEFYLEHSFSNGMCFDSVSVYDGSSTADPMVGEFCGTTRPMDIMSTTNYVYISFKSDETTNDRGFRVFFSSKYAVPHTGDEEDFIPIEFELAQPIQSGNKPSNQSQSSSNQSQPSNNQSQSSDSPCGMPQVMPRVLTRIVGGEEANPHSWPWQCSLLYSGNSWKHWCGATVIHACWILTAAHCVYSKGGKENFRVVLGEHSFLLKEGTEREVQVDDIIVHEKYNPDNNDNDIALIKLSVCVVFDRNVQPVCLPQVNPPPNQTCVATGWGETKQTGNENVLNQVCLPIIDRQQCNHPSWYFGQLTTSMFCAGFQEGIKDSCSGDSGGPLVCLVGGQWVQMGLTSWGYDCAQANHPGIYTNVYMFKDWITHKVDAKS